MPEERTPTPVEKAQRLDHKIIVLLLDRETQRPWSEEEIEREFGCDVTDSLARLYAAGLSSRFTDASRHHDAKRAARP